MVLPIIHVASNTSCDKRFFYLGESEFILDVCKADYISTNFIKPRYPRKFWTYMQAPEEYFGFAYKMSPRVYKVIMKTLVLEMAVKKASDIFYRQDVLDKAWGIRYIKHAKIKTNTGDYTIPGYWKYSGHLKPWSFRLAAKYKKSRGIRWFSTTSRLFQPLPDTIHPRTIWFLGNNLYAILAISNHPSINFSDLQKIAINKKFPSPYDLYSKYDTNKILLTKRHTNLPETLESNLVISFKSLSNNNVIIGTYDCMKNIIDYNKLECLQMRPDFISNWMHASYFLFKGILGIDQKHKAPTLYGRNQIISRPVENYEDLLEIYRIKLESKFTPLSIEQRKALKLLENTQKDPNEHIKVWAERLHLFPDKGKPPLLLDKTFDESHLNAEALQLLRKGEAYIVHVSDYLYTLEKTPEGLGSLDDSALDYLQDTFIQKMLGGDESSATTNSDAFDVD